MAHFVGIASFNRPGVFGLCCRSLLDKNDVRGFILSIDAPDHGDHDRYASTIRFLRASGKEVLLDVTRGRRGSPAARNAILDLAEQNLRREDVLTMYDDDYISPRGGSFSATERWLNCHRVGIVGGKLIDLGRRRVDPGFAFGAIPGLANALTRLTGFVLQDTRRGPSYVDFTTPLMAMRGEMAKKGLRYDVNYRGTAYREESDYQEQARGLGYKIVFEPKFYAYHLNVEEGGNRSDKDPTHRFTWKLVNNTYFMQKHRKGRGALLLSNTIILAYSSLYGLDVLKSAANLHKECLRKAGQ